MYRGQIYKNKCQEMWKFAVCSKQIFMVHILIKTAGGTGCNVRQLLSTEEAVIALGGRY